MKVSHEFGKHLRCEALERRAMLSVNLGSTETPAVETSIALPIGGLLQDLTQNVQVFQQTVANVKDAGILSSLATDLASLTGNIDQILRNLGTAAAGGNLAIQTNVTSTTDPQTAARLQSVLTNVANDLRMIDSAAGSLGTGISSSLSNQITASLTQVGGVISGVNGTVNRDIAAAANTVFGNSGGSGAAPGPVGNVTDITAAQSPGVFGAASAAVNPAFESANVEMQTLDALANTLPPEAVISATTTAPNIGGPASSLTDLLSTLFNSPNNSAGVVPPAVREFGSAAPTSINSVGSVTSVNRTTVGLPQFNQAGLIQAGPGEGELLRDFVLGLGLEMPTVPEDRGRILAHLLAGSWHSAR